MHCVLCTVYRALCEGILCTVHCVKVYSVKRVVLGHVVCLDNAGDYVEK